MSLGGGSLGISGGMAYRLRSLLGDAPDPNSDAAKAFTAAGVAAAEQRRRAAGMAGRASTILTSNSGVTAPPVPQRQTLLGA